MVVGRYSEDEDGQASLLCSGHHPTFSILLITAAADDAAPLKQAQEIFQPLPKDMATAEFPITRERVELGRSLFFDPRLTPDRSTRKASRSIPALSRK
jgi:cytochrome c peroxidase